MMSLTTDGRDNRYLLRIWPLLGKVESLVGNLVFFDSPVTSSAENSSFMVSTTGSALWQPIRGTVIRGDELCFLSMGSVVLSWLCFVFIGFVWGRRRDEEEGALLGQQEAPLLLRRSFSSCQIIVSLPTTAPQQSSTKFCPGARNQSLAKNVPPKPMYGIILSGYFTW